MKNPKDNPYSTYWLKRADYRWSQMICQAGCCAVCGRRGYLEAHHLIRRNYFATRHRVECGMCLCRHHHRFCDQVSPHLVPKAFEAWLKQAYPERYQWVQDHESRQLVEKVDYQRAYEALRESVAMNL